MGVLRLAVLGPPLAEHQGEALVLPTRKTLALLVYLAMTEGMQSRTDLARLFWPGSTPAQRLTTLRSKLHALRQSVGDVSLTASPTSVHQHLIVQRHSIGLVQERLELDVKQLQKALTHGVGPGSSPTVDDRLTRFEEAVRLVRGPFLEGLALDDLPAFEEWLMSQQAYWQQQVNWLFEQFSQLALAQRSGGYAEQVARQWLTYDPTSEAAHQRLMQALLAQGKATESLDIFYGYRRLVQQLNLPVVTSEMEALAARVQSAARVASSTSPPPTMTLAGRTELTTPFDLPLVGRDQESGQLINAVHQARSGGIQVVLVRGEEGIGKTHLVTALTDWARAQKMEVLWGRGIGVGGQLPYSSLLEALRPRLEREHAPEDLLEDVWLSELSRLFPELRDRYPDLPPPLPEGSEGPVRLFEAVSLLTIAWAKRAPPLLVLDDVQWIDRATLDLLIYLLHRWKSQQIPILIVLIERLEAVETNTPLTMLLTELGRIVAIRRLELGPLRQQDVQKLVSQLVLSRSSPLQYISGTESLPGVASFSRWLFRETEGHPLFLVHTLRELLERKLLHYRSTAQTGWALDLSLVAASLEQLRDWVPTNVQEVIGSRLARLSTAAQSLLIATAVLGQEATFERLCQVADLAETAGLRALEEVLGHRLLREHHQSHYTSSPSYAFSHDKIRAVLVMRTSMTGLRLFHRRTLEVLEQQSIPAATLAFHALEAGVTDAAFRYGTQAGDEAMAVFAVQDAIRLYTKALDCLQRIHKSQDELYASPSLYTHLGRAYELVGQWEQARATYETMLALARTRQATKLAAVALTALALLVAQYEFELEKAQRLLYEAQMLANQTGDALLMGESAWNLGQMAAHAWQTTQAMQEGGQALQLAKAHSLTELTARSLYLLGLITLYRGEFEQAAQYLQAALAQYEKLDQVSEQSGVLTAYILFGGPSPSYQWTNQDAVIGCLSILAMAHVCQGELQDAHEAIERALALSQDRRNIWVVAWTRYNRNHVLLEQGAYERALRSIQEALEATRQVPNTVTRYYALVIYGFTLQELGPLDEALTAMEEALALIQAVPIPAYQVLLIPWMCVNRGLAGDWQSATRYALQARPLRVNAEATLLMMGFTSPYETEALLYGGYGEWARADVEMFGRRIGVNRRFRICYLRSLAVLAQHDGKPEQAIVYLHEAASLAEEIGIPRECWQIQARLGELYDGLGQSHQAEAAFAQASTILHELANRIQDKTLQRRFLEAQQVQRVLQARA